jgi:hypothetical protein
MHGNNGEFSFGKNIDLHENLCPLHSRDIIEMYSWSLIIYIRFSYFEITYYSHAWVLVIWEILFTLKYDSSL